MVYLQVYSIAAYLMSLMVLLVGWLFAPTSEMLIFVEVEGYCSMIQ
jgi:hypothetical protein